MRQQASTRSDGFEVLDVCHRQIVFTLGKLSALIARLRHGNDDEHARTMAAEIGAFFSSTVHQHHEDEERHVFPRLASSADPEIVQAVARLRQDHRWLEEDWREIAPQLDAIASGQTWYDLDTLHEAVKVFTELLYDHMALEESCIYPQVRERLGASGRTEMGREMAARRRAHAD